MIIGLQITGAIFALLMIYLSIVHYKKGSLNSLEIAVWLSIWVLVILVVIFPDIVRAYSMSFSVSRVLDLLIAGGFILTITMVTSAYIRVNKLERKMEDLIRKLALKDSEKK
ncbi:MAG: DUF2304 domain-containing protein [bacterium]|nr:DUF2304 domain-containing protein [bacterium]